MLRHIAIAAVVLSACAGDRVDAPSHAGRVDTLQQSATFSVVTDTYIKAGRTPRDAATTIWADNITSTSRAHALLKFDLRGQSGAVSAASLQLNVEDSGGGFEIYELKRNFDAVADWNNYAAGAAWTMPGAGSTTSDRGTTVLGTVNCPSTGTCVTSLNSAGVALVQAWVDSGNAAAGLLLVGTTAENIGFTSSEGSGTLKPRLNVSFGATVPATRDTYIKAGQTPRDAAPTVWVDNVTTTSRAHGLLKFDFGGQSGTVLASSLQLNVTEPGRGFAIYELKRDFDGVADWQSYASGASWATAGAGSTTSDRGGTVLGTVDCPQVGTCLTALNASGVSLIQSWVDSRATNAGLILVGTTAENIGFGSIEGSSALRPKLLLTLGAAPPPSPPPPPPSAPLRVVSFNVKKGGTTGELVDDQCRLMASTNADVLLLQEVPNQAAPRSYTEYVRQMRLITGDGNWDSRFPGVHSAPMVMSRLPIETSESRVIGQNSFGGSRYAVRVAVRVGGQIVQVWGTHIDIQESNGVWSCGYCQSNTDALVRWMNESPFVGQRKVVGGDFNANLSSGAEQRYVIESILANGFVDTSVEAYGSNSAVPITNNGWRPDHIFRSSTGLSTNASQVISNAGTSDHHLLLSELAIQ